MQQIFAYLPHLRLRHPRRHQGPRHSLPPDARPSPGAYFGGDFRVLIDPNRITFNAILDS